MEISDEDAMRSLRGGNEEGLRILMDRYQQLLVNHFRRRGVQEEYEDLAQETFFRIYKARRRYRVQAKFRTWMFTIAERVWIDFVRKSARRQQREQAFRNDPRRSSDSPSTGTWDDLQWALDQLPDAQRDVVVLANLDGLSQAEIAKVLDIPEGTVKSRHHHAMHKLRTLFQQEAP